MLAAQIMRSGCRISFRTPAGLMPLLFAINLDHVIEADIRFAFVAFFGTLDRVDSLESCLYRVLWHVFPSPLFLPKITVSLFYLPKTALSDTKKLLENTTNNSVIYFLQHYALYFFTLQQSLLSCRPQVRFLSGAPELYQAVIDNNLWLPVVVSSPLFLPFTALCSLFLLRVSITHGSVLLYALTSRHQSKSQTNRTAL